MRLGKPGQGPVFSPAFTIFVSTKTANMVKILWVDDEIELLKPHVLFLRGKGYEVDTCNNGYDAIDMATEGNYDLIILDEMMPGMTGLETLPKIKEIRPTTPVIMVTKSEEENIMDKAVGSKIADYLIKPVNPNQVLLSIKKNVHSQQLVTEQTTADYRAEFGRLSSALQMADRLRRLVQRLSPDHELGDRALRFDRPKHQGGHRIPEARSQPGVLQVRPPELLRLDQQARRNHPGHVAYAHAVEDLPGGRRESQDHAAADRQLPLRPVALDQPLCCAATTTSRPTISTARSCPRRPSTPAMPFSPA